MKKLLLFLSIILLSNQSALAKTNLGDKISDKKDTKINDVMEKPDLYLGKTFVIKGRVVDVCTERGCWMKVSSEDNKKNIIVKVNDGEMVFPLKFRGKNATIEGQFYKIDKKDKDGKLQKVFYQFKPKGIEVED